MASNNSKVNIERKSAGLFLLIISYVFFLVVAVAVMPVVLPKIWGYHAHTVKNDTTGMVSQVSSVVYTNDTAIKSLVGADPIAVSFDGSKEVTVCRVSKNNIDDQTITITLVSDEGVKTDEVVNYDKVVGYVVAYTPFIGVLTHLCDSIMGCIFVGLLVVVGVVLNIVSKKM